INVIDPPAALILRCTRSALKKRNRTGDSGDPCGRPAWGNSRTADVYPFTTIDAVREEQNASTHLTSLSGSPLAFILWSSRSLHPPLYAPLTSILTKLSTFRALHAL